MENLIEATILTGPFEGEAVLIPRIPMIPTDLPFQFKRLQFPIRLAFAITINKAQGQSLAKCGIDLNTDCFSHGQLYVACSRVGKPDNLFKNELIEKVFPNILKNYKNNKWLSERTILAPKNIDVHEINNIVLTKIRDQAVLYKSVDTVLEPNEAVNYLSEFLNSIDPSGFPPHVLQLKIGVPIILLRNINPPKLCNGTRLAVKKNNGKPNRGHNLDTFF